MLTEHLRTTGCKIGEQAFIIPRVGARAVQMLSRTTLYVILEKLSLLGVSIRTIDTIHILGFSFIISPVNVVRNPKELKSHRD